MRKDLVWQDVDFRVDFRSDRIVLPAEMFRRRRKKARYRRSQGNKRRTK